MKIVMRNVTAQTFGKYSRCTLDGRSGLFYAWEDMIFGKPAPGSLPSPHRQDTPEKLARAKAMHEKAANKVLRKFLRKQKRGRLMRRLLSYIGRT